MKSVLLVRGWTGAIHRNSGAQIPFDIFPVIESAEVVVDRAFRIREQNSHPRSGLESMKRAAEALWL